MKRSLKWDMDAVAVETWTKIHAGDSRRIRLREDTITEANLLDLAISHPEVHLHRFNQHAEKKSGADWEWYIGTGSTWFCLRIQAKRMDGMEYRQLQHEGGGDTEDYQYDTLINSSAAEWPVTFPYYVFFNGWSEWPPGVEWHGCPRGRPRSLCAHVSDPELGCAAMPARMVRAIHGGRGAPGRKVEEYLPFSLPWSWLFPPEGHSPLLESRRSDLATLHPRAIFGADFNPGYLVPREWGAVATAPPNPTVLQTLRWHRAIGVEMDILASMNEQDLSAWRRDDARHGLRGLWPRVAAAWREMDDSFEGLGELPPHAQLVRDLSLGDFEGDETIARVESELGPRQMNVLVTELALGEAARSSPSTE